MFKKIIQWKHNRIQKKYDLVISHYSKEDQEKILNGRNSLLTILSKEEFENRTNLKTRCISDIKMPYDKSTIFGFIPYDSNVCYWYELGKLETDIMFSVPNIRIGPDAFQISVGLPAKIVGGETTKEDMYKIPHMVIGGNISYLIKKLEKRNLIK